MRPRAATGDFVLLFGVGASGCESATYGVEADVSYDSSIGYDGTFDFYEPKSDGSQTNRPAAVMGHPAPWSGAELRDISTVTFARPDVSVLTVHGAGSAPRCVAVFLVQ